MEIESLENLGRFTYVRLSFAHLQGECHDSFYISVLHGWLKHVIKIVIKQPIVQASDLFN